MNLNEYEAFLAAKYELLSPEDFEKFLAAELLERVRINVGLLAENEQLKRKLKSVHENDESSTLADFHEDNPHAIKLAYELIGKVLEQHEYS